MREMNLVFEAKVENFWELRPEFLRINPSGEVPVYVSDEDGIICGSYAISEYFNEVYDSKAIFGKTVAERAEVRRIIAWFDNKFNAEVTRNLLFEKIFKRFLGRGGPSSEAIRAGKENLRFHLDYIGYLAERRTWLAGDRFTLADIAAAAQISVIDYIGDIDWSYNAPAKEWYSLMKSRPSFRTILQERTVGIRPPDYYEDPDF